MQSVYTHTPTVPVMTTVVNKYASAVTTRMHALNCTRYEEITVERNKFT